MLSKVRWFRWIVLFVMAVVLSPIIALFGPHPNIAHLGYSPIGRFVVRAIMGLPAPEFLLNVYYRYWIMVFGVALMVCLFMEIYRSIRNR